MVEIVIYLVLACVLMALSHVLSGLKSGCFYAAQRQKVPKKLQKYMKNLHYVQTPYWYCLFGAFILVLFAVHRLLHPDSIVVGILSSYLIAQGTSAVAGLWYQKYINIGAGKPEIDPDELKKMELADPLSGLKVWIPKFWAGKNRVWASIGGVLFVILGLVLMCKP